MSDRTATAKIILFKPQLDAYQRRVARLTARLQRVAPKTYWVGGAVRDMLLGREHHDTDIATELEPKDVTQELRKLGLGVHRVGEKFGTIGAILGKHTVEITTFRSESDYSDKRHPAAVRYIRDAAGDASRRDFTVNALYFDPVCNQILDYAGGVADLRARRLRFVGNARASIHEDPLRMLRGARFAAMLGFSLGASDAAAVKRNSKLIASVPGQRVKAEIDAVLLSKSNGSGVKMLHALGLLKFIFPEVDRLSKVKQSKDFHAEGSAFIHSLEVLRLLPANASLPLRYAALLHDIGKHSTAKKSIRNGRAHISFYNHAAVGAEMFGAIARRYPFSREERNEISYLIDRHMWLMNAAEISEKKLISAAKSPFFEDLIVLRIADNLGSIMTDRRGKAIDEGISRLKALARKTRQWKKFFSEPLITGADVMRELDIAPGKKVGDILARVERARAQKKISTRQEALKLLKTLDMRNEQ